jgi:hypothetical protein
LQSFKGEDDTDSLSPPYLAVEPSDQSLFQAPRQLLLVFADQPETYLGQEAPSFEKLELPVLPDLLLKVSARVPSEN